MGCCGQRSSHQPAPSGKGTSKQGGLPGAEGMVEVEYVGGNAGTVTWVGPVTGHPYRFGGKRLRGYVDRRDAAGDPPRVTGLVDVKIGDKRQFRYAPPSPPVNGGEKAPQPAAPPPAPAPRPVKTKPAPIPPQPAPVVVKDAVPPVAPAPKPAPPAPPVDEVLVIVAAEGDAEAVMATSAPVIDPGELSVQGVAALVRGGGVYDWTSMLDLELAGKKRKSVVAVLERAAGERVQYA